MELAYLENISKEFNYYKLLGEKTLDQLSEAEINWIPNDEGNSIATIVKHLSGNMQSRWTNLFHEDGEKSWRNRDHEFINEETINESSANNKNKKALDEFCINLNLKAELSQNKCVHFDLRFNRW